MMDESEIDQEIQKDIQANHLESRVIPEPMPDFAMVTGLCRACDHAFITQRQYGDAVQVICQYIRREVPHDIVQCSQYRKRGHIDVRDLIDRAILIDPRPDPKGYL